MIYWQLFLSFLQMGAFSFGGGYAVIPLLQNEVVNIHGWLQMKEFHDLITISQMTPGPIAINSATFVGIKMAGIPGALMATIGCILPSCIIVTLIAYMYLHYRKGDMLQCVLIALRPAVVAMIASAGLSIIIRAFWNNAEIHITTLQITVVINFVICVYLLRKNKLGPIGVMMFAGVFHVMSMLIT